ncbi:MAG: topoisomerase DNA-binding C4 zinc finger domain-containing protein [Methanosarcinales archaeon]|jgi:DNA topoisomerase-1|nr:topoisomerase DNA-binding C4 zinc finger domain-containing protein [Methanosarcinales archaeon]
MTIVAFAEKNKAAEEIANILGRGDYKRASIEGIAVYRFKRNGVDWAITGLAGHIMNYDFPAEYNSWTGVDPGSLLDISPVKKITKENFAFAVEQLAKEADMIILACDYDREGENIGFEAKELAERVSNAPVKRARYSAFSKNEIENAFDRPGEPDTALAMAAETRQILDLKMGAAFTRYVTLSVREKAFTKDILSIGPCQTPTCGFVYEREKAIREFSSKDFWKITADFDAGGHVFQGTHRAGHIPEKEKADEIMARIKNEKTAAVHKKNIREQSLAPPFPLNTTEFLKRASAFLNISPEKSLEIAEQLYLSGLTSYPRTETNKYAGDFDFKTVLAEMAKNSDYTAAVSQIVTASAGIKSKNGPKDAKDHPPIHPIRGAVKQTVENAVKLPGAYAVYDLICRHFLANLMPAAVFEKTKLEMKIKDDLFDAAGSVKKFSGWLEIYDFETKNDKFLPDIDEEDTAAVKKIINTASKTAPPKKLTEAELLTLMDKNGIGTKATAPTHIETNKKRGYFESKGKTLSILNTGYMLMESLDAAVPILVRPKIRAQVEELIQRVEDGKITMDEAVINGTELIKKMYADLTENKDRLVIKLSGSIKTEAAVEDKKNYIGVCPVCQNALRIVTTDNGRFVGCVGYPDCSQTYPLPKTGALTVQRTKNCLKKGAAVLDVGKKYEWAVGVGPCFSCDQNIVCNPPEIIGLCPRCKEGGMQLIEYKENRFLKCTLQCGHTQSLPEKGRLTVLENKCAVCGWNMFRVKEQGKDAAEFCANRRCKAIGKRKETETK